MSTKTEEMEACPKCGGQPTRHETWASATGHEYGYACSKCDVGVGLYPTEAEAIAAWNRRPTVPGLVEDLRNLAVRISNSHVEPVHARIATAAAEALAALSPASHDSRHSTPEEQARAVAIGKHLDAEDGGYPAHDSRLADEAETAWLTWSAGIRYDKATFMAGYRAALARSTPAPDALREAFAKRAGTTVVAGGGELPHCKVYFETVDDAHAFDAALPRKTQALRNEGKPS